ncbi:MAG: hypothetical protein CFH06_01904 [Alphaproteobacteria bacterium MarineAlpha3_Bin5]|nr:rhizopine catabolism protein [Magnetovibrio sp.]PPR75727.1 MAG: hypothetical protein CFH06_01904 [Alphaproteobacteria bacterium MarineAlpha3_Bin5]
MDDFIGRKNLIPKERLKELCKRSDLKGWAQTLSHFGAIALTGTGLYATLDSYWVVPFFIAHGILLNYLFAAQHEYNHYTAFKTRWLNDVFNRITGFIQLYPRDFERWYHFEHHRNTQDWKNDPELISRGKPYTLWTYLPYLIGVTYWTGRIQRLFVVALGKTAPYFTETQARTIVLESQLHIAAYSCIALISIYFDSYLVLTYWIAPLFTTKIFQNVQNITEHTGLSHNPDTVHNTRTIDTWWIFKWMAWNMQYHTAHHTFPAVPFYNLPLLHAELVKHIGFTPPTTSYIRFQCRFIRQLIKAPETWDGVPEVHPLTDSG